MDPAGFWTCTVQAPYQNLVLTEIFNQNLHRIFPNTEDYFKSELVTCYSSKEKKQLEIG